MAPGKAHTTGMVPTILLKEGKPVLIAGAPGGSVIISATLQAILNVIDFGMSPVEAVTVRASTPKARASTLRRRCRARSSQSCERWATRSCTARTASSR